MSILQNVRKTCYIQGILCAYLFYTDNFILINTEALTSLRSEKDFMVLLYRLESAILAASCRLQENEKKLAIIKSRR
jgi:hypothetical protein